MTIIEALKSGKRFRRKAHCSWYEPPIQADAAEFTFEVRNILADDWELEPEPEEKIEITRDKLQDIYTKVHGGLCWKLNRNIEVAASENTQLFEAFVKELGFKS